MSQALTPWSVKGIDEETRKTARQKAKEAGLPIGTWIDKIILEQQAQVSRDDSNLLNSEEQNAYEPKEHISYFMIYQTLIKILPQPKLASAF